MCSGATAMVGVNSCKKSTEGQKEAQIEYLGLLDRSQGLHCILTLCLSPPTLQLPVTSCRVSITGNHVFRATAPASAQKALEAARAEAGRLEGAGHCRWPSGLRRLSLPPTQPLEAKFHSVSRRDTCLDVQFSRVPHQLGSFCSSISSHWGLGWTLRSQGSATNPPWSLLGPCSPLCCFTGSWS